MWCLRWTIKLCGWLSSVVTSLHLKLPKHWKLKWTWYMPPTRRLNAEQAQQNYSLSSSTNVAMHGRIIMSRGGSGGRRSSRTGRQQQVHAFKRCCDGRGGRCECHCSGGRRAERTNSRRQRWDIGVEPTGNDAMSRTTGHSIHRRSCMFSVFPMNRTLHPGRDRTTMSAWCK